MLFKSFHWIFICSMLVTMAIPSNAEESLLDLSAACPDGYDRVKENCYQFNLDSPVTWDEARDYCQDIGGDLAVIKTCGELGAIVRHIHMSGKEVPELFAYWVGGTDRGDEGAWFWVDGTPMAMGVPFWGEVENFPEPGGGADQNCAQLYQQDRYYIHDGICDKHAYALCQYGVVADLSIGRK